LQRSLEGIAERKRRGSAPPQAPPAPDPYAWAPTAAHRAFANARVLRLRVAADAYRAARMPDDLGTLRANEDFMRRLHWWADNGGEFPATGKLPRPAREAVGA
jgi:hypothetical protein